ncbi:MAG: hypothetical protein WBG57_05895 [Ornithinimicrobium sp.]
MSIEFTPSAERHGVSREDALYAMLHPDGMEEVEGHEDETTFVYVGRAHAQSEQRLEVVAAHRPPRTVVVFHVMPLTDLYRHLLAEREDQ